LDECASAYIQARQRLPHECLERVLAATAQAAERRAASSPRLQGRPVKVVDGSSVQLPDTAANQKAYPQPSGQKPGCGFPVLKLVVLFSLASGALLDVVLGNLHQHDLRLFHRLWECLKAGDILLGDRAYGDYVTLAGLPRQGVDVVARLHQARKVDFRRAKRLSHNGRRCRRKSKCVSCASPLRAGAFALSRSRWSPRCSTPICIPRRNWSRCISGAGASSCACGM